MLKISALTLKEMTAKAVKGASNNKLLPLTSLICIEAKEGKLTLTTYDGSNYLYIMGKAEGEDFYVTVQAEQFSKLISKLTCENVELELTDKALEVNGDGHYKIDLPLDEEGDIIQFPNPLAEMELSNNPEQVELTTIKTILNGCRSSLATTLEVPCYTGYYCGDKVIATDTNKIAGLDARLFNVDVLISPEMMNLLDVMTAEKIDVHIGDMLVFATPDCTVVGRPMDGIEEFSVEAITALLETPTDSTFIDSKCTVSKSTLLSLLERIALFVGPYDDKAIRLTFTENGINIESLQSNGVELIPFVTSDAFAAFTCKVDIEYLLQEVKSIAGDVVEIHYGLENAIKFVEGNMTIVIALMED